MVSVSLTTIERMKRLLSTWERDGDQRSVFLGCYHMMTQNMLRAIRENEFIDPDWVEKLLHHFADHCLINTVIYRTIDAVALLESDGPAQIKDHHARVEQQAIQRGRVILRVG